MSGRQTQPPGGNPPPESAPIGDGATLQLEPLAREICRRYADEFPDEGERYGTAGSAWCIHDNLYLLSWAADSVQGYVDMRQQVGWLASVLEARSFPLARLARNLDLAGTVTRDHVPGHLGEPLAAVLDDAAALVRSRSTFLALGDYQEAAAAGDTEAAFDLGVLLTKSDPPDLVGARHWWEQAATAGHAGAALNLGVLLHTQLHPADLNGARHWYEQAAKAGNADAAASLSGLLTELHPARETDGTVRGSERGPGRS